jgi:hypothetical protein
MELLSEILADLQAFTQNCRDAKQKQLAKQISDKLTVDLYASRKTSKSNSLEKSKSKSQKTLNHRHSNSMVFERKTRSDTQIFRSSETSLGYEMYQAQLPSSHLSFEENYENCAVYEDYTNDILPRSYEKFEICSGGGHVGGNVSGDVSGTLERKVATEYIESLAKMATAQRSLSRVSSIKDTLSRVSKLQLSEIDDLTKG